MQATIQVPKRHAGTRRPKQPKTSATALGAEVACIDPSRYFSKGFAGLKTFTVLLICGFLLALTVGCQSTTTERPHWGSSLAAAGFKLYPADNPKQVLWINSLPADRITPIQRGGMTYYTYPDSKHRALYVGRQQQYDRYRNLHPEPTAIEQLSQTQNYDDAAMGSWSTWSP